MAIVLDAFASYLGDLLKQVAEEELGVMLGISGEIDKMGMKLKDLKNLLADAERRRITDESVQEWVAELKRAMYEATDILDLCHLKIMERGSSTPDVGCCNPLLFCLRNPRFAHEIGGRIKKLNQTLDSIKERSAAFSFLHLDSYEDRRTASPNAAYRKTDPVLERSSVVGEKIEEDTKALVQKLRNRNGIDSIMVFAIVGVGGIGKTTLAKKVFNDEAIEHGFNTKIWLSITKEFSEAELLKTAIVAAKGILPQGWTQDKSLLVPALESAMRNKKLFLVLDDMWGNTEWNNLLKAPFSHGAPGSRVLITTRHDNVARGMKAVHPYHHVEKLEPQDGWSLLKKQVLRNDKSESEVDTLKDIGLKIIAKCDGLPLAVKVVGGLLCQRGKDRHNWEKVLNDSIWSVSQMTEELNYAIHLSYEDLSPCLKQCFLHFSLKPKKMILGDIHFVSMWIGEGFVHGDSDRLEELGIEYHKELIVRNLIEPDTSYSGQYVCQMHDVVRSFAQYMTRDESLVVRNGESYNRKLRLERFLRVSIETKGVESEEFGWRSLQEQKSLRSLILTGKFKIRPGDSLVIFSSLRILHVEFTDFAGLVESLYQLKHLRYLSVVSSDIKSLPESIHKMKFLQHIRLVRCKNLVKFPDSIVNLRQLRYLNLGGYVNSMPRGFHALTKLRTLNGFQAHMDGEWCSLEELGPLSQLRKIGLFGLENVSTPLFAVTAKLHEKVHLSLMSLGCSSRPGDDGLVKEGVSEKDQGIIEEVFDELCPPSCIEDIHIWGYFGRQLPRWMMSTTMTPLNSLRILKIDGLACCTQLTDGLCQLPCLEFLRVNQAPAIKLIGPEFVQPHSQLLHPSSQAAVAFPRLHKLIFDKMVEWEEWEWNVEVQAMPSLEELYIRTSKLRFIPSGLASNARALKKLSIRTVQRLQFLENFDSVVELDLSDLPDLARISNFPKLQKLEIYCCRKLKSLQEINALRRLVLTVHYREKQLPMYLQNVKPSHLLMDCSREVLASMALGKSGPEWDKFSHIQNVEAYADDVDGGIEKRWHLFYTSEPYNMETNIDL
ncbi:unnamed protein product [Alopecurus aequalis]